MLEYIKGEIASLNPAQMVLENRGVGYLVHISLQTFTAFQNKDNIKVFIHEVIREDAHLLYGFSTENERELFRHLISVSGVGSNTARMMLSSLSTDELTQAILSANADLLKNIKGIGAKTAQRIIVDLKDKVGTGSVDEQILFNSNNTRLEEALSALVALGFAKSQSEKALKKISAKEPDLLVEELIKSALKQM